MALEAQHVVGIEKQVEIVAAAVEAGQLVMTAKAEGVVRPKGTPGRLLLGIVKILHGVSPPSGKASFSTTI